MHMYICIILCISNTVLINAVLNIMCHPYTYAGGLSVPPNGGLSLHISGLCQSSEVHLLHPITLLLFFTSFASLIQSSPSLPPSLPPSLISLSLPFSSPLPPSLFLTLCLPSPFPPSLPLPLSLSCSSSSLQLGHHSPHHLHLHLPPPQLHHLSLLGLGHPHLSATEMSVPTAPGRWSLLS